MNRVSVLGIDLAKSVFQLHGVDERGKVVMKRRVNRAELPVVIGNLPSCLIGMEACGGANYWARKFQAMGHDVKVMPPQYVKPYVKTNKNDANDAEAICEAVTRPNMRFSSIKSIEQQDVQSLHRIRRRLIKSRTALVNETRGLLLEYGIIVAKNPGKLRKLLPQIIEDEMNGLTAMARQTLQTLLEEFRSIDERVDEYDERLAVVFKGNEVCRRIGQVAGIGPITATAIFAMTYDPHSYRNGRHFSAALGLVPKQYSSGGKERLLGISKRGDTYLRSLLVHGARAALLSAKKKTDRTSLWALEKVRTRGHNRACVALANKNARVIWAMMVRGESYRPAAA